MQNFNNLFKSKKKNLSSEKFSTVPNIWKYEEHESPN